jgi:Zn-dependent protease
LDKLETFILIAPVLLFSMVAHEYAHGYAAFRQGDPTAYQLGRLTWNPIKHLDPFMSVLLPLITYFTTGMAFGGAKPVPVNPRHYKHYKRGDIIVSLAGVTANALTAIAFTALIVVVGMVGDAAPGLRDSLALLQRMLIYGILFNCVLVFFNLLPIPPLDGSHVVKYLLPPSWAMRYQQIGGAGLLIVFLFASMASPIWSRPAFALTMRALHVTSGFLLPGALPQPQ